MKRKLIALTLALLVVCLPALADQAAREDILDAMEVYAWFVISPLDVDDELLAPDGEMCLLLDDSLHHTEIMQRYLDFYFSAEIAQSLWDWGTYADVDGLLYGYPLDKSGIARPVDAGISEVDYELTDETASKRTYTVTINYLTADSSENVETLEFISENVAGQWVFTQFPFFW